MNVVDEGKRPGLRQRSLSTLVPAGALCLLVCLLKLMPTLRGHNTSMMSCWGGHKKVLSWISTCWMARGRTNDAYLSALGMWWGTGLPRSFSHLSLSPEAETLVLCWGCGLGPHTATPGCRKQIWESWGRSADTVQRATGEGGGHSEQVEEVARVMGEGQAEWAHS